MITFAYPTLAAPSVQVLLPDVEKLPVSRPRRKLQQQFETDAGTVIVYDFGGEVRAFSLRLFPLSKAEAQQVDDFFTFPVGGGGVNGRTARWELEDSAGHIFAVRFDQDVLDPVQRAVNAYELIVTVRVVG